MHFWIILGSNSLILWLLFWCADDDVVGDTNKLFVLMSYNKNKNNTLNSHSMERTSMFLLFFQFFIKICGTKTYNNYNKWRALKTLKKKKNNSNKRETPCSSPCIKQCRKNICWLSNYHFKFIMNNTRIIKIIFC